jgi:hypothetical protein
MRKRRGIIRNVTRSYACRDTAATRYAYSHLTLDGVRIMRYGTNFRKMMILRSWVGHDDYDNPPGHGRIFNSTARASLVQKVGYGYFPCSTKSKTKNEIDSIVELGKVSLTTPLV